MGVNIFNDSIIGCKMGTDTIDAIYQGTELLYSSVPPVYKYKIKVSGGTSMTGVCDSTSALTSFDIPINARKVLEIEVGECVSTFGIANFPNLTSLTLSDSVTTIKNNGFRYLTALTTVEIPSGVTSIGDYAFAGNSMTYITLLPTTPPSLGNYIFYNTPIEHIYVPSESVDTYKAASGWSEYASIIEAIP